MEQILVVPDFALVLYLGQTKRAVLFFEREAEEPAEKNAIADLCQMLLSTSEFLYVE